MSSRAIVTAYRFPNIQPDGNFQIFVDALYTDPVIPGSGKYLQPIVVLDASNPAGWSAAIKQEVTNIGVANGFPDLVTTSVFIPTYG